MSSDRSPVAAAAGVGAAPLRRRLLLALFVLAGVPLAAGAAQERTMTLTGNGTLESRVLPGRGTSAREATARELREARLTLGADAGFAATLIGRGTNLLVRGTWERPGLGNVERIVVRTVAGESVRGTGTLSYEAGGRTVPRRLALQWSAGDGEHRVELALPGADDDPPGSWTAGSGTRVHANIDARASGDGLARMQGVRGGDFGVVRARIGTGGDVILDVDQPTRGEIRGRVRRVQGRRIEVAVSTVFGYTATGTLTVRLRSADEVARWQGAGAGERGPWSLDFEGTGMPNDLPLPAGGATATALLMDRAERGRGALIRGESLGLELGRASVRLERGRIATLVLEARRERVTIEARWLEGDGGMVQLEVRRINGREGSGRLTLRREGASFGWIEGDGRVEGEPFTLVFVAR